MISLDNILSLVEAEDKNILVEFFKNAPEYIIERSVIKNMSSGQKLFHAAQKADTVYFHISGKLAGIDVFTDGVVYNFIELLPFNIIGEFEAFSGKSNYLITIQALTKSSLIAIDVEDFLRWMQSDVGALFNICRILSRKLSEELKANREYLFLNSYNRLLLYFYNYCKTSKQASQTTTIHKKRSEIADEIGFCVKTINRTIQKMVFDGLIVSSRNSIKITPEQFQLLHKKVEEENLL